MKSQEFPCNDQINVRLKAHCRTSKTIDYHDLFSPLEHLFGTSLLKCIFQYTMPQSIWIMQDRADVAWSKSVIVEVRKGDEGMLIHVPSTLGFVSCPSPKSGCRSSHAQSLPEDWLLSHQLVYSSILNERFPVYLRHSQPAVKENAQKR